MEGQPLEADSMLSRLRTARPLATADWGDTLASGQRLDADGHDIPSGSKFYRSGGRENRADNMVNETKETTSVGVRHDAAQAQGVVHDLPMPGMQGDWKAL